MIKKTTVISLLILFGLSALAGGGWTKKKGKGFYKLSEYWLIADRHYTSNGLTDPNVTTGIFITSLYAEHGMSDKWTAIAYLPLFARNYTNNLVSETTGDLISAGEAINSIGDVDFAMKYGIIRDKKVVLASTFLLGLPTGKTGGGSQGNLQTGDGEFNQMLRLDLSSSHQVKGQTIYANLYGAANNRTEGFSDEWRFGGEIGLGLWKERIWATYKVDRLISRKNGSATNSEGTALFGNNLEFLSYGVEVSVKPQPKWGLSAGYATATQGTLILAAPSYTLGVFLDIQ